MNAFVLLLIVIGSAGANVIHKYDPPCPEEEYRYDDFYGMFLCTVPSADECRHLCIKKECYEWNEGNKYSPFDKKEVEGHVCRCLPEISMCFYNTISHSPERKFLYTREWEREE